MALYRSPDYQTSFESIDLSVQEFNTDFQDCDHGGHLEFTIRTICDLHVISILPMKFEPAGFSVKETKIEIGFQAGGRAGHLGFSIGRILAIFFIFKLPLYFLSRFESVGLLG